ncbi:GH92 family glycosyl hydrolase [Parapedobacter sp. ISTM3]|uniref:GH92 family glycosyl hydrolase n=1 Tax=Parapedobacter sp. ISTM3 TaxID=2800130 RepID=UPI0019040484|nr:GH92 family glycosyl hydrolase [Parapedobacter sp. ISTM3]MBK1440963.1 GH92 family glycosyl hydrolase [Parapedobacter sp. ISTM3]
MPFKFLSALGGITAFAILTVLAQERLPANASYMDPRIGNVGHILEPTRPTVHLPNQAMRMYPLRKDQLDDQIDGFPLLVVSHRLGEAFVIKPHAGSIGPDAWDQRLLRDPDLEVIHPWHYAARLLEPDVDVAFVPGNKTGIFRFSFPTADAHHLLLSLRGDKGSWRFDGDSVLYGTEIYRPNVNVYVYARLQAAGKVTMQVHGDSGRAHVSLPAGQDAQAEFRYAISFIDHEQARRNYEHELAGTSFEAMRARGEQVWHEVADQIQVSGGTEAQRRVFYTALYRCYERMVDITEDGRYYSGYDNRVHQTDRPFYVDDWAWDTYLAHHPLRIILNPAQQADMLNSYLAMYAQSGWLPTFPVVFGDHACMNGFHSSVNFLDAYRKGVTGFPVHQAYEGMRKNAISATMIPWRNGPATSLDSLYEPLGYFPSLHPGEAETEPLVDGFEKRQSVAVTLGHSYDDWALAEMAKLLGHDADAQRFGKRADYYKNLWHPKHQLFMPKDALGNWIDIDPKFDGGMGGRDYYDENNGWTYAWQVQHDIPGLITLNGGKAAFEQRLDQLFREGLGRPKYEFNSKFPDATGLVGQFSMGNEPSFHIPYLYNYTDSPWKTQKRIRMLIDTWFKDNEFGIPGDEDGGGMSAFVVFSMMGFYPITPGIPEYTIGSPVFEEVRIALPNGKTFTVKAPGSSPRNKYIHAAKLNGEPLSNLSFTHDALVAGGTLELEMAETPLRR